MLVSPVCFLYNRSMNYNLNSLNKCKYAAVLPAVLIILAAAWLSVDIYNKINKSDNVVTVSATSEVYAKSDLALTTFSVVTDAKTVGEAMQENTDKMNAVTAFVKNQGVEDKDLQTTNFNISPRYEWVEKTGQRILAGYEVSQSLQIKIRDLTKVGDIIQGATGAGANEIGNLQFIIDNEDALREEARNKAIVEAKNKAKVLAENLGIRLIKIVDFNENGVYPVPYYTSMAKEALGMGGAAPDIQIGENKISSTVTLTYQIK